MRRLHLLPSLVVLDEDGAVDLREDLRRSICRSARRGQRAGRRTDGCGRQRQRGEIARGLTRGRSDHRYSVAISRDTGGQQEAVGRLIRLASTDVHLNRFSSGALEDLDREVL